MKKGTKRNWTMVTFYGRTDHFLVHWIDFYQMVMLAHWAKKLIWLLFEFGIPCLFVGIIMWQVGRYISSRSLLIKNHPFLKESMIHHT